MRGVAVAILIAAVIVAAAFWIVTIPRRLDPERLAGLKPGDPAHGEQVFWAGGCSSCHARPKAKGAAQLELVGGVALNTPFGTFYTPNISPDRSDGIGAWSFSDFANALMRGVSPDGRHYYPAFPYPSYTRLRPQDVADLYAFMRTLPPVKSNPPPHKLKFPFNIRRGIGIWKLLYLSDKPVVQLPADVSALAREGQYLVEGPGHCGECHTPRNAIGGLQTDEWLAGAVAVEGKGTVPNITSGPGGIGDWSAKDIAYFLESGFTPDYDSVGGAMVEVQENIAKLPARDRDAIAAYLKAVPPRPNGYPAEAK